MVLPVRGKGKEVTSPSCRVYSTLAQGLTDVLYFGN